jgi:hypothetical protein
MSEAVDVVSKMISCYPNGGQNAGRSYIGALGAVLVTYPAVIARRSKDPVLGVPRECKFLPTPSDVIAWCERELTELRRPVDYADRHADVKRQVGTQRDEEDYWKKARLTHATDAELRARYGQHFGISQQKRYAKPYKSPTDDELRALYGKRHDDPDEKPIAF